LVEQRTENPCVPGSIPGGTTLNTRNNLFIRTLRVFCFQQPLKCTCICTFFLETLLIYNPIIHSHTREQTPTKYKD